jgi:hypothetical protein
MHVNEPTTVYTRKRSVSLPLGHGILSKPAADSSPIDVEGLVGQELLEIFEVSANFHFVGTILVCDRYSCRTIYEINNWDQTYYDFTSRRNKWVSSGNAAVKFKVRDHSCFFLMNLISHSLYPYFLLILSVC